MLGDDGKTKIRMESVAGPGSSPVSGGETKCDFEDTECLGRPKGQWLRV